MIKPRYQTLGEVVFRDIENNDYLKEIVRNILHNYSLSLFNIHNAEWKEINLTDALRFADLLSKSSYSEKHKGLSQQMIALLFYLYPDNQNVKIYAKSILEAVGNYRGVQLINSNFNSFSFFEDLFSQFDKNYLAVPFNEGKYFFHPQKTIYDKLPKGSFSYSGPTSLGKSFVLRTFIKEQISKDFNGNFAILVPTKALINEISKGLINELKELLNEKNYVVINSSGALALKDKHNYIFIMTPERMLYLMISFPNIQIDYLFIDEAHKISSNDERSAFYYKITSLFNQRNHNTKVIFSSPNIPNPYEYLKLLPGIDNYKEHYLATTYSPVSHLKYVVDLVDNNIRMYNPLENKFHDIKPLNNYSSRISILNQLTRHEEGKQSIIYCSSIDDAITLAREFADNLPIKDNVPELLSLSKAITNEIHHDYYLPELIKKGVSFHVGYLPNYIRSDIEELFREQKITTLFCTSTLIEGVNLPADNLFVMSYKRGSSNLNNIEFKNLIGRVGRIEYNLYGNIFLIRDSIDIKKDKYESLITEDIKEQTLSLVTSLSNKQKKLIVNSLMEGNVQLERYPKNQTNDNYNLMRKFSIILLKEITSNKKDIVYKSFENLLNEDKISIIKENFTLNKKILPDDDINISVDQSKRLKNAIESGLSYPPNNNGKFDYHDILEFLNELSKIFMWEVYESKRDIGNPATLRYYSVILNQWMTGYGLSQIIGKSIEYKQDTESIIYINNKPHSYDNSRYHKNIVISSTLNEIENIILFKFSNYFLRFSTEYKEFHGIEDTFENDWYEYVEYGSTNKLTIFLQRNGFTRETSNFIRKNKDDYVYSYDDNIKLKKTLLNVGNKSIRDEVTQIFYNLPNLFV